MGDPTSSYATAGIALRVSGALKPYHHDRVETQSVGLTTTLPFLSLPENGIGAEAWDSTILYDNRFLKIVS
jgi:hypothetical protein